MRYFGIFLILILFSCNNKEQVLLPKSNISIVKKIEDLSPVYIFFKIDNKDTLAEVNRNNTIGSTNWVFNIDKRLSLKLVLPEIIKLQEKRRTASMHQNELAQNYYTYNDTIEKNLAFIAFTEVHYKMGKPKYGVVVFFNQRNEILVNDVIVKRENIEVYLNRLPSDKPNKFQFCFDKDLDFGSYIQNKIFIQSMKIEGKSSEEFIY